MNNHLEAINQKLKEKIANGYVKDLVLKHFDNWKAKVEKQSQYLSKFNKQLSAEQDQYLKKQDERARQEIFKTMTNREGLPAAAQ